LSCGIWLDEPCRELPHRLLCELVPHAVVVHDQLSDQLVPRSNAVTARAGATPKKQPEEPPCADLGSRAKRNPGHPYCSSMPTCPPHAVESNPSAIPTCVQSGFLRRQQCLVLGALACATNTSSPLSHNSCGMMVSALDVFQVTGSHIPRSGSNIAHRPPRKADSCCGQVARTSRNKDGLATALVGYEAPRTYPGCVAGPGSTIGVHA
jgi:hypothetical protein